MTLPTTLFPSFYDRHAVTADDLPVDECEGADRPADTYVLDEMVATTGASPKQVDHWTRGGYLHPLPRKHATNGAARRWPEAERDVCARMALLVDVGLSLDLAHRVARHVGPYVERGVTIRITPDEQTATTAEREILRQPGRVAVATVLHALVDNATAAAELLDEADPVVDCDLAPIPAAERHDVETLTMLGHLLTGTPKSTHSNERAVTGE